MSNLKRVAIITSGGDAPGMNACIRAITLSCLRYNIEQIYGFKRGYNGLLNNKYELLTNKMIRNIIHLGGTILKSARCPEFSTEKAAIDAAKILDEHEIQALFVIGGDGSFRGAAHLSKYWQGQVIGLPGTIDNDIDGTDVTIGYYTAIDTAVEAIDKIRDTADAFDRVFLVEVMGRQSGFLAVNAGIASSADQIVSPEFYQNAQQTLNSIVNNIKAGQARRGKTSGIIVVAENFWPGGVSALADLLSQQLNIDCRHIILSYIQRGGSPSSQDRILATKLGAAAVEYALAGRTKIMVGQASTRICCYPLDKTGNHSKPVEEDLLSLQAKILNDGVNINQKISNNYSFALIGNDDQTTQSLIKEPLKVDDVTPSSPSN